jgi:cobalamin biosynthesis protein CbiD
MAGTKPVTHVSVRGEHGIVIHIPVDDQEAILAIARADTQDEISDTTTDTEVLSKIRAKAHRGVRLWALGHGVPYAPDE